MNPVVITAATHQELAVLIKGVGAAESTGVTGQTVFTGKQGACPVVMAVTGIGKVNTAATVTALLEAFTPRLLINTGIAGAYIGSSLAVGELAVATTEIYGDEGVADAAGWHSLEMIGIPSLERQGRRYFNEFPLSLGPAQQAVQLAATLGITARRGRFVTVSTCTGTTERGNELASRFNAVCENMEGAAAVHVALRYGVDCLEVRGISNLVEDRDLSRWNIPLAAERVQRFLLKYLENLDLE